jgi:hypothetical protein
MFISTVIKSRSAQHDMRIALELFLASDSLVLNLCDAKFRHRQISVGLRCKERNVHFTIFYASEMGE